MNPCSYMYSKELKTCPYKKDFDSFGEDKYFLELVIMFAQLVNKCAKSRELYTSEREFNNW